MQFSFKNVLSARKDPAEGSGTYKTAQNRHDYQEVSPCVGHTTGCVHATPTIDPYELCAFLLCRTTKRERCMMLQDDGGHTKM